MNIVFPAGKPCINVTIFTFVNIFSQSSSFNLGILKIAFVPNAPEFALYSAIALFRLSWIESCITARLCWLKADALSSPLVNKICVSSFSNSLYFVPSIFTAFFGVTILFKLEFSLIQLLNFTALSLYSLAL